MSNGKIACEISVKLVRNGLARVFNIPSVNIVDVVLSGHKSPQLCLEMLEDILASYPQGGVIIPIVGLSNGLGPILSARTSWPVIAVPASVAKSSYDVWSSLSMPSNVPMMTVLSSKNAFLAAYNLLAAKNPVVYMLRQYDLELLDY
jgi:phosphoribosylaminoimidazole carboxylase/phosphoribosylaminoimidazole-succinocarboxamide synthase